MRLPAGRLRMLKDPAFLKEKRLSVSTAPFIFILTLFLFFFLFGFDLMFGA